MSENLQKRKKEIIEQIGIDGLKQLKFSKILKLLRSEIQELMSYWIIKQVHQMVNEVFNINISSPFFYKFCQNFEKNPIKKDRKLESLKTEKIKNLNISQNRDTKKESENIERGQLKIAQTKELKDDGQLKVADKSEFI